MPTHELIGGKLQVYRRKNSRFWQCAASVGGKQRKSSTKQESLALAQQVAEDWYLTLMGKSRAGLLMSEKTFRQASEQFLKEYEIITEGQRSPRWVEGHRGRLRLHLVPFFGELGVSHVTPGKVQEYRVHRATTPPVGKLPTYKQPARAAANNEPVPAQVIIRQQSTEPLLAAPSTMKS